VNLIYACYTAPYTVAAWGDKLNADAEYRIEQVDVQGGIEHARYSTRASLLDMQ
jgi:hypothetical protein